MNKKILKLLYLPLRLVNFLFIKNSNIWLFGSWFGLKYADNTKYLFEYVNKNDLNIKAIWISHNKDILNQVRKKGYIAYHPHSILGIYYILRAKVGIVTQGNIDINRYLKIPVLINIWHGNPMKKIGIDALPNSKRKQRKQNIYAVGSSYIEATHLSTAFGLDIENILITGYPRNDVFSTSISSSKILKVIYMPTHRNEGKIDITKFIINDLNLINERLKKEDILLYFKVHFYDMKGNMFDGMSNIKILNDDDINKDIYSVINSYDILITDYSGIYFDFLLSEKPIIFAPFDIEDYQKNDRGFYYNYDEITAGPKCYNWNEVLKWIENFSKDPSLYSNERKKAKNMFHLYQDYKYSERLYHNIKTIINKEKI
jgi:CDP-glycerol glycerophosphotransferase (TagB/SpsB family)